MISNKINRFEDIVAWQKAKVLTAEIYILFRSSKDFSFKDQIQRASVSIMNNIAEGFERKGNREFRNFLYISKGSCAEVRSMFLLGSDLGYIQGAKLTQLLNLSEEISKMLSGFIKTL